MSSNGSSVNRKQMEEARNKPRHFWAVKGKPICFGFGFDEIILSPVHIVELKSGPMHCQAYQPPFSRVITKEGR